MKLQERQLEIEEDLWLAGRVQNSLAPRSLVRDKVSVDSFYHPVHSIGGDFALVDSQDRENVSLLVCDVSGHGIGSALVANRIYSETMAHLRGGTPILEMFGELNRFLIEESRMGRELTGLSKACHVRCNHRDYVGHFESGLSLITAD